MANVLLVDAAGMSISMLAAKMNEYAQANGLDYEVTGLADSAALDFINEKKPVVIMIAPQVSYMFKKYDEKYSDTIPVVNIPMMEYGMMNGEAIMKLAIASEK
jgi:PTS system cellobiose-specific IIB component